MSDESPEQSLIRLDQSTFSVAIDKEAETLKADALEKVAMIVRVNDAESQEKAVAGQKAVLAVIRAVEKARQAAKEPILALGRALDAKAAEFVELLNEEGMRVAGLINDFQQKERVRIQAEAELQDNALTRLDREKAEKLSLAESVEEQDAIRQEYSHKEHLASTPIAPPPRARGQMVKPDFEITVTDVHELYRFHPNCVRPVPIMSELKALAAAGVKIRGVTVKPITRSTARTATKEI